MKKAFVAIALAAIYSTASATIINGAHDLSNYPSRYANPLISACQFCHAPHNVNTGASGSSGGSYVNHPLWNRYDPTSGGTAISFYANVADTAVSVGPGSLACLSCHDGVSDLGRTYVGTRGFAAATPLAAASAYANLGRDLRNDHPIGVNQRAVGEGFQTVAYATQQGVRFYTVSAETNVVECGSCHDPHGTWDKASGGAGFLRVAATAICEACHNK